MSEKIIIETTDELMKKAFQKYPETGDILQVLKGDIILPVRTFISRERNPGLAVLCHTGISKHYQFIDLSTGFNVFHGRTFQRLDKKCGSDFMVPIPRQYLEGWTKVRVVNPPCLITEAFK